MWLLLVAAGSGYLARCWRNALQQRPPPPPPPPSAETDCNQDDPSKEQQHSFDPLSSFQAEALGRRLLCDVALIASTGDNNAIEPAAKMTNQAENALGQKKTGMKVEFDRDERIGTQMESSFPRRTTKRLFDSSASDRGEVLAPGGSVLESSSDTTQQEVLWNERGKDTVPIAAAGKRTVEFSNRAVHDGDHAVGFEVKRMRDSHEFKVGQGQEQGLLSAFTFLDNPGFNALWFAPQDGEASIRGNGLKSKTPSRSSRVRGVLRRPRYLRASPKPVSSLESCLRAQLRFQGEREENRVSRSLFFQPYGEGSSPGFGEVEALHTNMGPDLQLGGELGLRRKHAGLPLLGKPSIRRTDLSSKKHTVNSDKSSHDALLFSFGVGVGVLHMLTSKKSEIERLKKCLKETESTVQDLQLQIESRGNAKEPSLKIRSDSKHVETASDDSLTEDHDSAPSGVTAEEQDNIAELEAQLEAELELMQLQSAPQHERIYSGITELDADDLAEVVHDELTTRGLPGVFDLEDDKNQSGHAEGNVSNWAVSPRELDKRLRMLLESRQEERILQLEEELQDAEDKLHCKEKELQLWKDRVRHLTEISISSSGESVSLKDEEVNSLKKEVTSNELHLEDKLERSVDAQTSHAAVSHQGPKLEKAMDQSLSDDICDEFLKCVDTGSSEGGLETIGRELRSDTCPSNVSDYVHFIENWQDVIGLHEHESCSKGHYKVSVGDDKAANIMQLDTKIESSTFQPDGTSALKDPDKHRTVSTSRNEFELDLADSNIEQERRAICAWSRNLISHAGANTPIVDFQLNKLFNTPRALRARGQEAAKDNATVLEKIKYWESLAKGSEVPSSPEGGHYSQTDQISPVHFSCSEGNSSWEDSSVSDPEEHLGDVLIKRIVEKSRKGSTLLRDVQTMLAALDGDAR